MEEAACLPCAAEAFSISAGGTPYTEEDAKWLARHQHTKVLDARVRIVGVAARSHDSDDHMAGAPAVLLCYPLRVTRREAAHGTAAEGTHAQRRETRGGSTNKWTAAAPVPWPNLYWLVDPNLAQAAGRLEHRGLVQSWQQEVGTNGALAAELAASHRAYGATRWALLSDDDREYALSQPWVASLRDTGVGGMRNETQVKCLHVHLAHTLAGGANPVGERVLRLIRDGVDEQTGLREFFVTDSDTKSQTHGQTAAPETRDGDGSIET